jgi:energy-coupling factor transporter ATP-binding protein EcfA2
MIEFKDVSFQYEQGNSKGKIENINLTIQDGEVVLICGESGCGKTTLTRLINGLIPHYYEGTLTGQTIVEGIDVKNTSLYALSGVVGSVFQNPRTQFFTVDTTSEIAFGCENLAINSNEIELRIKKTAGELKIENLLNQSLFALSGGEKQKIACASVSAMEPDILVLDEPSSNLDIQSIRELKNVLKEWKARGKTIVIAEHRLYYLMDIADRVVYMRDGQIKENLPISDFKKKSTDELHALGLRSLQSEDFSKMRNVTCTTKQLYIRNFEVIYKNASVEKKKKRKVLDISDLMIPQGSVVGVIGNNGAGKTTFAHNLCGLLPNAKGCMYMNGKTYMANQRIKTCYMVMQDVNHQLFTESVMDEILLSLSDPDEEKAALEAESIMENLRISEFRDAHPMSLSGGQKQRVAIASAIASNKEVIIFDEPTSGLDYRHMKKVAENLRELSALGKTMFIVTHDPELIVECCNYFVFIENGKVLWSDGWNRISRERLQRFFTFRA